LIQGKICDFDLTHANGILGITWTISPTLSLLGFAYLGFYGFIAPNITKTRHQVESEGGGTLAQKTVL
jgi:FHS family L-fucose permease-like MFS transporter